MNIVRPRLMDCRWLDLCSGSGVMACEAIERGARAVTAVEKDPRCANVCKRNLEDVAKAHSGRTEVTVIRRDLLLWLKHGCGGIGYDLIYFDPPYQAKLYDPVLDLLHGRELLASEGRLICEFDSKQVPVIDSRSWRIEDRRDYGKTGLLFLSINRPEHCHGGTGSMQPQKGPEA